MIGLLSSRGIAGGPSRLSVAAAAARVYSRDNSSPKPFTPTTRLVSLPKRKTRPEDWMRIDSTRLVKDIEKIKGRKNILLDCLEAVQEYEDRTGILKHLETARPQLSRKKKLLYDMNPNTRAYSTVSANRFDFHHASGASATPTGGSNKRQFSSSSSNYQRLPPRAGEKSAAAEIPRVYQKKGKFSSPWVLLFGLACGLGGMVLHRDSTFFFHEKIEPRLLRLLPAETAHRLSILIAKSGRAPQDLSPEMSELQTSVWGMNFSNCIGLAAGCDKHAEAMDGLFGMGFGFVEVGSVTPEPQEGNSKPRMFRLVEDRAVINRYGFNSDGLAAVRERLLAWRAVHHAWCTCDASTAATSAVSRQILGVNLGKNKETDDAAEDYVKGIKSLSGLADYIVVNVSSPNTPGLRTLQKKEHLEDLVKASASFVML